MFRKINRVLRTAILITGAGVLLAKLAEKDPQQNNYRRGSRMSRLWFEISGSATATSLTAP